MFITRRAPHLAVLTLASLLSACGLTQRVADGTGAATQALFYKPVKTLRLDFQARPGLNSDPGQMQALALATQVRVYQLRNPGALSRADLRRLLSNDSQGLEAAWLAVDQLVVEPGVAAQLRVPLADETRAVAVLGLFRAPDLTGDSWHLLLPRDSLEADRAQVIELHEQALSASGIPAQAS